MESAAIERLRPRFVRLVVWVIDWTDTNELAKLFVMVTIVAGDGASSWELKQGRAFIHTRRLGRQVETVDLYHANQTNNAKHRTDTEKGRNPRSAEKNIHHIKTC
jgi:hypothetical protein